MDTLLAANSLAEYLQTNGVPFFGPLDESTAMIVAAIVHVALVGAWFSITPMTRASTLLAPLGAAISKSFESSLRPTCTVLLAVSG